MIFRRLSGALKDYWKRVQSLQPERERPLFQFATTEDVTKWTPFSDFEHGGLSTTTFQPTGNGTALLSGHFSSELREGASPRLRRSGFCGIISKSVYGAVDLEDCDHLVLRVKGDGRPYILSLRAESLVTGDEISPDLWQTFFRPRMQEWHEVAVRLDGLVLTHRGRVVDSPTSPNLRRVQSLSIGLAGSDAVQKAGPYTLELDWIRGERRGMAFEAFD